MKNKNLSIALFSLMLLASCERNSDINQEEEYNSLSNVIAKKDVTLDSLLQNGYTLVKSKSSISEKGINNLNNVYKTANNQIINSRELLSLSHLRNMGYNDDALRNLYKKSNVKPDGLFFNGITISKGRGDFYDSSNPAYFNLTGTLGSAVNRSEGPSVQVATKTVTNSTDLSSDSGITYTTTSGSSVSNTVTHKVDVGVKQKVKFIIGETEFSFTYGFSEANQETLSKQTTITSTDVVKLQPKSKVTFIVLKTTVTEQYNYTTNTTIDGVLSSNFPKRVDGHYYWPQAGSKLLENKKREQKGVINYSYDKYDVLIKKSDL